MSTSPPSALTPDQLDSWAALATLLVRLPATLDAQLQRDSGLTHFEHGLLYALDVAPERTLRMSTLAGYANSTLSRLSRAATRLEAKGWLQRTPDPADGRFTLAILTDDGHDVVVEATPAHHALVRRLVFETLGEDDARQLGALSRRVAATVSGDAAWAPPGSARGLSTGAAEPSTDQ